MSHVTCLQWASAVLRLIAQAVQEYDPLSAPTISELLHQIIALASTSETQYSLLESSLSMENMRCAMLGEVLDISPVQVLDIKAPRKYLKYFCHSCLNEWPGYEIRDAEGNRKLPDHCNWCKSSVWNDPEKAAYQRLLKIRRAERRQHTPVSTRGHIKIG